MHYICHYAIFASWLCSGTTTKEDSDKVYRRGSRSPCLYTPEYKYFILRDLRSETMAKHFDYTTYNVTFLDDTFGLKTLTFNNKECAQDFANDLVLKQCDFVHLYQSQVSTIYLKDESILYVQNFK